LIPDKSIGRLSLYRRILNTIHDDSRRNIYSHELAAIAGSSAAQVRRDIMNIGYSGNPNRGYDIKDLSTSIGNFLDAPEGQRVALVGVGNLGRAILAYFSGRRPKLTIDAAFDSDPKKTGRVIHGCHCYSINELDETTVNLSLTVGIITVPASEAQKTADSLIRSGITGLLNFAPVRLKTPPSVYIEDIDMTMSLEKVAYFARINENGR